MSALVVTTCPNCGTGKVFDCPYTQSIENGFWAATILCVPCMCEGYQHHPVMVPFRESLEEDWS